MKLSKLIDTLQYYYDEEGELDVDINISGENTTTTGIINGVLVIEN